MTAKLSRAQEELLLVPQTSGGLVIAVPLDHAGLLVEELLTAGVKASTAIGETFPAGRAKVHVV